MKSESSTPLKVPPDLQPPQQTSTYQVADGDVSSATSDVKELEKLEIPPQLDTTKMAKLEISGESEEKSKDEERLSVHTARNTEGYDLLVVDAEFDKTWDRVGTAVVAMGFNIADQNRGQGIYNIYQNINKVMTEEEKFTRPRFDKGLREEYRLYVEDRDNQTRITVQNTAGKADDSALAKHLLAQLQTQLSAETNTEKKTDAANDSDE